MKVIQLDLDDKKVQDKLKEFCKKSFNITVYQTYEWYLSIKDYLEGTSCYFAVLDDNEDIAGYLPAFILQEQGRSVINAMPTMRGFGGYGGIALKDKDNAEQVIKLLLDNFISYAEDNNCITATVCLNPKEETLKYYKEYFKPDKILESFAQINDLQQGFQYNTRIKRSIKKAGKQDFNIVNCKNEEYLKRFYDIHKNRMEVIGVEPKPWVLFKSYYDNLIYDKQVITFYAVDDEEVIGGLMLVFYNNLVDYFVPAIKPEYWNSQLNSYLIYYAMKDFMDKGYRYWNWQASDNKECGNYKFKQNWGPETMPVYYLTKYFDDIADIEKYFADKQDKYKWYFKYSK